MNKPALSPKGQELIALYERMATEGYDRVDEQRVDVAFSSFELRHYRENVRDIFDEHDIHSVLDYGCGGSDWTLANFDPQSGAHALGYFEVEQAYRYEPARAIDERQGVECVTCFDVLEHVFIADVPAVLRDILSYASKAVLLNVACYPAAAKLPNGENAHITVRDPNWWKGVLDAVCIEYPDIIIYLWCSKGWRQTIGFPPWSANGWQRSETFVVRN